jgi:hypothetical protein
MHTPSAPRSTIGIAGAALAVVSGILILALAFLSIAGFVGSPYIGILAYLVLPGLFVAGLLLIPLGNWWERKRARQAAERGEAVPHLPVIDLNDGVTRRRVLVFVSITVLNVLILAFATYQGLHLMDSPAFCGSCHSVMDPEATAHSRSPHARVACVECHIGSGASWFVKSKLSGLWQVVSVSFDLYQRPIPTPVAELRPARGTCEECHWPSKFLGDSLRVTTVYSEDEKNTPKQTVVLLHVGGGHTVAGPRSGIHAHVAPGVLMRYLADPKREKISTVELSYEGQTTVFRSPDSPKDLPPATGWRQMDCIDCHNRASHRFRLPGPEMDAAMFNGRIDPALPWVKREGMKALKVEYPSHEAARAGIEKQILDFYRTLDAAAWPGREAKVKEAAGELGNIWGWNVWPSMKITWGTYASLAGHEQAPGCFRCHDGEHRSESGKVISQDCGLCHSLLAVEEQSPKILTDLRP